MGEQGFGSGKLVYRFGVFGAGVAQCAGGLAARLGYLGEGVAFVFQVAFGGFDQIGNQVVPPLQLYADLGEGIAVLVLRDYQPVVYHHADHTEGGQQ